MADHRPPCGRYHRPGRADAHERSEVDVVGMFMLSGSDEWIVNLR
jgi:hypothetical protein